MAHGLAGFAETWERFAASEMPLQVGISDARLAIGREGVADTQNDEPSSLAGIEDTGAIAKTAGLSACLLYTSRCV